MRRSGGLKELAVVVALVALAAWRLGMPELPSPAVTPTPTPVPVASPPINWWWELAKLDLDARAANLPGYAEARALQPPESRRGSRALYQEHCLGCHEHYREGPMITTGPPNDLSVPSTYKCGTGELAIFRTIKHGIPRTGMAPLIASDADLWAITFYVRSLQKQPRPSEERRGRE